ncbi:MAG: crotonase/enoyl-CoA hydratase family protein [Yoonia sp.]|uniref:crotonase/enoyl-CoA hydratase family protein n=1 Tax=Yoonia sp. TaxID=2212373 RepID=UPI00273F3996|nr:crotonase/enoyl-CoA hydratase family protein [Yoonia sp.]MDP5084036.1 crotonase/enoyl-CoA hydratase family protein [Yoonia sp.]MDP5361789.1 crotonase/enoyl-CoA hydratase family protein [Paracoccaceae bacterium]
MIDLQVDARGVATLALARPEKHNALSQALIDALKAAATEIAADDAVRVVVLTAQGRSFCAGGDLGWMRTQMAGDRAMRRAAAQSLAGMLGALNTLPKPLIGRVQGNAFGGGVGLACVCDVVIAADHAQFGLTETRLGLIPATIGPYVLARMGEAFARRVFMSGRVFDAAEAARLGVIAKAVPADQLDAAIASEVAPYLGCAPGAVAAAKALARSLGPVIDEKVVARSVDALVAQWDSAEAKEGISAFFDKRKPRWGTEL